MRKGEAPKIVKGRITRETAWVTAGDYLAVCTGLGSTIEAARTSAYRLIDMLDYPNKMYRTDIGVKVMKNIQKLHRLGYAGSMK
jgi:phosphoribosylamine-glycine ligase